MALPLLQMSAISKRFPGVVALDRVDFHVAGGEIVGLVGENGAGKSTLMKILTGIHQADSGGISFDGAPVVMHGPADAAYLGIAIIHQELEVIDTIDVAGNVFLGREPHRAGPLRLLDRRRMEAETVRQLARIGAQIPPRTVLRQLSTAQQQLVAITRALSMNARLLVLDEPTSSLGASEAERLFQVLRDLRSAGTAIVYISHRLREIEALADRAVVLRDGRNAGLLHRGELTRDRIVRLMVGRAIASLDSARDKPLDSARDKPLDSARDKPLDSARGEPGLYLDRVRTPRYPAVEVSLSVYRGEVLGLAGLIGAGRSELAEAICGVGTRVSGRVLLDGRAVPPNSPGDAIRAGLCLVPQDRRRHGVIAAMSVRENITLPAVDSYARLGWVKRSAEAQAADAIATNLLVKASSIEAAAATLSGGNQQKVALGKWLARQPRAIIFDEPTQGVDVGAKAEIHRLIRQLAGQGTTVVMISSDMDEIVAESDRVAVMHEGRITGILDKAACTPEAIMQLAVA
jgi:ribose transport system ATP-binding protein